MCGLCAARCPAEIVQYNIAILCRRLYGSHIERAEHVEERIKEIEEGKFDKEIEELMEMDVERLKELYSEREIEK
ncbi:MAG: hypothetical protein ACXQT5_00505 [Candidatus Syntropharchaeia archaeon]